MSLRNRIAALIASAGPITVADYMILCLHDPAGGYYASHPALGEGGDFITAPHVSQMFGECLGLWAAEAWARLGEPARVRLVEVGPGDGTMMTDVLRAARAVPAFLDACEPWLVETSAPLRALQERALALATMPVRWVATLTDLPEDAPVIILANEFLDCLPIRQAVWHGLGWTERRVGLDATGQLIFLPPLWGEGAKVWEWSPALVAFGEVVGGLISRAGGGALFIDYGRDEPGGGDTLQAVRRHAKESPLSDPGGADLTAHVDFPAFLAAALEAGAMTSGIQPQGRFLRARGIVARADALQKAHPGQAAQIGRQLDRLIGDDQMGRLFKVACLHSRGLAPP